MTKSQNGMHITPFWRANNFQKVVLDVEQDSGSRPIAGGGTKRVLELLHLKRVGPKITEDALVEWVRRNRRELE